MILMIILSMLFLHIIADFCVQNEFMARFKQKKEWSILDLKFNLNRPDDARRFSKKYEHDYIPVLFVHAFSWAFITFIPMLHYVYCTKTLKIEVWCIWVIIQTFLHMYIDHQKCNKFRINLIYDQFLHFLQIIAGGLLVWILS